MFRDIRLMFCVEPAPTVETSGDEDDSEESEAD
jgi:hypothetical protein